MQFIDFIKIITPYTLGIVFLLIYLSEHIFPQRKDLIDHKHDAINILVGLLNLVLVFTGGYYFQQFIEFTNARHFGILQLLQMPFFIELFAGVLFIDCFLYWWHRINHLVPFFWYFHKFHHKDEKMNSTTAVRFHTGELILSYVVKIILFPLLGVSLGSVLLHAFILFPVILFHHSNIKISMEKDLFLRKFFVTPQMHRLHHSVIKFDTDSNYSSILPYWDMIFKTYHKKTDKPVKFGI